jgi:hypothetical protein
MIIVRTLLLLGVVLVAPAFAEEGAVLGLVGMADVGC